MDTPTPEPVVVTNFPEQSFDWVGFSSLVISVIALVVALWSVWWSRKTWQLDGPNLEANARFGLRSNDAIDKGSGVHYSLSIFISNKGRSPLQCQVSALEFYGVGSPPERLYIDAIAETLSIESGHFWHKSFERNETVQALQRIGKQLSHVSLLIMTVNGSEHFELDQVNIEYLNKVIKAK